MPTEDLFLTDTISFAHAFDVMEANQLTDVQINTMLYGLLAQNLSETRRVFSYSATFQATKPACVPTFERSFEHVDWIDGESVVQAEENSIEEGFNSRFHKIEDDLDALFGDVTKAFGCIGEMREELAARLTEVRQAINTINNDIYEKHKDDDGGGYWSGPYYPTDPPVFTGPGGITGPITNPPLWGGRDPWIPGQTIPIGGYGPVIGGYGPAVGGDAPWSQPVSFDGMIAELGNVTYPGAAVTRAINDPSQATVAGMPARRLDVQEVNGKVHEVWSTGVGLVLTPAAEGVTLETNIERTWTSKRTEAVGNVAAWVSENDGKLREVFGNESKTVAEISEQFGETRLEGGTKLRDVLVALPSGTKISKPSEIVGMLADRAATAVKREGLASETLVANVGFQQNNEQTDALSLANLKSIPLDARKKLIAQGIKTVGDFNATSPEKISDALGDVAGGVSVGQAARWVGEAQVISRLGKIR